MTLKNVNYISLENFVKKKHACLTKQIFLQRLFSCLLDGRNHIGFIPDILIILCKYNLYEFLITYISDGNFPDNLQWKRIIVNAVESKHNNDWLIRINSDNDFKRFRINKLIIDTRTKFSIYAKRAPRPQKTQIYP